MKAVSLWQPWATLMWLRLKKNETRGWATSYSGDLAIHAAKHIEKSVLHLPEFQKALAPYGIDLLKEHAGKVLCVVNLRACVQSWKIRPTLSAEELAFGDYSTGRFAWITDSLRPIEPFSYRGQQGLFSVPDSLFRWLHEKEVEL